MEMEIRMPDNDIAESRSGMERMESLAGSRAPLSRRAFLQGTGLVLGGLALGTPVLAGAADAKPLLRVGLLTDVHHADKDTRGSRHYRDSLEKLREAIAVFNEHEPAFVVHLGDLIDAGTDIEQEMKNLQEVEGVMATLEAERHYVLGNHCVDGLTKDEFIAHTALETAHYGWERGGIKFIVLDSCYRTDGEAYGRHNFEWTDPNIPADQVAWLKETLAQGDGPVIVFAHQRLDDAGQYCVRNAPEIRAVLEESGRVLAVFQGHSHRQDYQQIQGIHYCTQVAMIEGPGPESSAYSMLSIYPDASLRLEGFRRQEAIDFS